MYTPRSQTRRQRSLLWADETMDKNSPPVPKWKTGAQRPWEAPFEDVDDTGAVPYETAPEEHYEEDYHNVTREADRIMEVLWRYALAVSAMEVKIDAGRWSRAEQLELSRIYNAVLESYTTRGKHLSSRTANSSKNLIARMAALMVRGSDLARDELAPRVTVARLDPRTAEMRREELLGRKKVLSLTLDKFEPAGGEFEDARDDLKTLVERSDARRQFQVARASAKARDYEAMDRAVRTAGYGLEKLPKKAAVTVLLYHVLLSRTDGALMDSTKRNLPERYSTMMSSHWFSQAVSDVTEDAKRLLPPRSM